MTAAEGFVLAGGQSSRMGHDKALLRFHDTTLIALALDKLRAAGPGGRIVGSRPDLSPYGEVLVDRHPGCGPLGGMEAALAATKQPLNLFLPVDLPLIPATFLAWMLDRAHSTGALATLPRVNGRPQPLCAVYHRDLLSPITAALRQGRHKVLAVIFSAANQPGEQDVFDVERVASAGPAFPRDSSLPLFRWFHNCNTADDVEAIRMH